MAYNLSPKRRRGLTRRNIFPLFAAVLLYSYFNFNDDYMNPNSWESRSLSEDNDIFFNSLHPRSLDESFQSQRHLKEDKVDEEREEGHSSASKSNRPNILLFVLDQWRHDWDGLHETAAQSNENLVHPPPPPPLSTPFLASLSKRGTRFTQAYVPSPICAPSRACLASGNEYDDTGVKYNHADDLPPSTTTFYKLLRDMAGYHTMTCGKDDLFKGDETFPAYPGVDYGFLQRWFGWMDLGFSDAIRSVGKTKVVREHAPFDNFRKFLEEREVVLDKTLTSENGTIQTFTSTVKGFDIYLDCWKNKLTGPDTNCRSDTFTKELYPDDYVATNALLLLNRKPKTSSEGIGEKPWFLQVNFPGPHPPMLATAEMAQSVVDRNWPGPVDATKDLIHQCPQKWSAHDKSEITPQTSGRCNYAAMIENIDKLMSLITSRLDDDNELEKTIVCVVGDHGEMLGDHDQTAKAKPWQGAVSVPLICAGPGIGQDVVWDFPVATMDLAGTFLDYAGYGRAPPFMTTRSLRSFLENESVSSNAVFGGGKINQMGLNEVRQAEISEGNAIDGGHQQYVNEPPLPPRDFVSSGYSTWRIVVKQVTTTSDDTVEPITSSFKLVCCRGVCPGSPSTASPKTPEGWHILLYDTIADPFDMNPLEEKLPHVVQELLPLLPSGWCVGHASDRRVHEEFTDRIRDDKFSIYGNEGESERELWDQLGVHCYGESDDDCFV